MNGFDFFLLIVASLLGTALLLSGFQLLQIGYNSLRVQSVVRIADDYLRKQQLLDEPRRWAEAHGFHWEGGFRLRQEGSTTPPVCVAIWVDADRTRWFLANLTVEGRQLELITDFSDGCELDTATSCYAHFFPQPPRVFVQSFEGLTADEVWSRHREGEEYLAAECGVVRQPRTGGAEQRLREAVRTRLDYARSHRFYGVRALYWYFVKMRCLHNKPIQELAPPAALASMRHAVPA